MSESLSEPHAAAFRNLALRAVGDSAGALNPQFQAGIAIFVLLSVATLFTVTARVRVARRVAAAGPVPTTGFPKELPGYPPQLCARPDFVALARTSPLYLCCGLAGLLNFALSLATTYVEWSVTTSPDYAAGRCGSSLASSTLQCWYLDELLYGASFCSKRKYSSGSAFWYLQCDLTASDDWYGRGEYVAASWAFALLHVATWLSFVASVQGFVTHQQVRRRITQALRGPLAKADCCVAADHPACPECCVTPLNRRRAAVAEGDGCDCTGGAGACCCVPTCFSNARVVFGLNASVLCLFVAAFALGGFPFARVGATGALAAGYRLCIVNVVFSWIITACAGLAYERVVAAGGEASMPDLTLGKPPLPGSGLPGFIPGGTVGALPFVAPNPAVAAAVQIARSVMGDAFPHDPRADGRYGYPAAPLGGPYGYPQGGYPQGGYPQGAYPQGAGPADQARGPQGGYFPAPPGAGGQGYGYGPQGYPAQANGGYGYAGPASDPAAVDGDPGDVPRKAAAAPPAAAVVGVDWGQQVPYARPVAGPATAQPYAGYAGAAQAQAQPQMAAPVPPGYTMMTVTGPDGRAIQALVPTQQRL